MYKRQTQLNQYTDLNEADTENIEKILPEEQHRAFRGIYLKTAQQLKTQQHKGSDQASAAIQQLDFEFVLFSSAVIDYDYIMGLIAKYTQNKPGKQTMTREQLIKLLSSSANLMEERDDIVAYINSLQAGQALSEAAIRQGYEQFKTRKSADELKQLAEKHGLEAAALQNFVDLIIKRMIFDGEQLSDLLAPLDLGWRCLLYTSDAADD